MDLVNDEHAAYKAGYEDGKEEGRAGRAELVEAVQEYFARPCDNTLRRLKALIQ